MRRIYRTDKQVLEPTKTLEEIADMMGCTRERVRQIEQTALGKVRKELYKRGLKAEDFFSTLKYDKPIETEEEDD